MDCSLPGSSVHGILQGKNTGVGCHVLLQGIFPTQGSNPWHLLHLLITGRFLPLAPPGKPLHNKRNPCNEKLLLLLLLSRFSRVRLCVIP